MESNKGLLRCKIVVVGDAQCGKTALLHVFAKNSYPEVRDGMQVNTSAKLRDKVSMQPDTCIVKLQNLLRSSHVGTD